MEYMMEIKINEIDQVIVFECTGKLDHTGIGELKKAVFDSLDKFKLIHLNLTRVTYANSLSLSGMIAIQIKVSEQGGIINYSNLSNHILELLSATQLDIEIDNFPTQEEALVHLQTTLINK